MRNRQRAAKLRLLARDFEKHGSVQIGTYRDQYSCNAVDYAFQAYEGTFGNTPTREAYFDTLLRSKTGLDRSQRLWNMSVAEKQNMRVLFLCFAAAMAETGDLLPK